MSDVTRDTVPGMAEAIAKRMRQRKLTPSSLAERTGLTQQGLAPLRRGERRNYQDRLKLPVADALGWTPDSIDRLLRGEPAIELTPGAGAGEDDLRAAVARLIEGVADLTARVGRLERKGRSASKLQPAPRPSAPSK